MAERNSEAYYLWLALLAVGTVIAMFAATTSLAGMGILVGFLGLTAVTIAGRLEKILRAIEKKSGE